MLDGCVHVDVVDEVKIEVVVVDEVLNLDDEGKN